MLQLSLAEECTAIPVSGPPVDHESLSNLSVQCCVSCIDSPAFVVEARKDISYLTVNLIRDAASVESALESQHSKPSPPFEDVSDAVRLSNLSVTLYNQVHNSADLSLSYGSIDQLRSIRSTVRSVFLDSRF